MAILDFPAGLVPVSSKWHLMPNTMQFVSPLSGHRTSKELPGAKWVCTYGFKSIDEDEARIAKAFVASMRGTTGKCRLHDPMFTTPKGNWGTPQVKGTLQTGRSLNIDGTTPSTTAAEIGDLFELNSEYFIITAPSVSDASGNTTIKFEPPITFTPADNAPIIVVKPKCVMSFIDNKQGPVSTQTILSSFTFSFIQA